jgi:hypothetical protein
MPRQSAEANELVAIVLTARQAAVLQHAISDALVRAREQKWIYWAKEFSLLENHVIRELADASSIS